MLRTLSSTILEQKLPYATKTLAVKTSARYPQRIFCNFNALMWHIIGHTIAYPNIN